MANQSIIACFLLILATSCSSTKKSASTSSDEDSDKPVTYANTFKKSQAIKLDEQTFQLDSVSIDDTYGFSQSNPIHVGGGFNEGATNQRRFLNALLGPDNELVTYHRLGSCCGFRSKNGMNGFGLLDRYEVSYPGLSKPIILYLNLYDYGILRAPKGFTFKK